jgi:RNA polymerase sigma factor (sigma-70 family)
MTDFDVLYKQYNNLVKYQLNEALNDNYNFDDILQDVWVKIYRNLHKYKGSFPKWSYSIIRSILIDKHRRQTAKKRMQIYIESDIYDYLYDIRYNIFLDSLSALSDMQKTIILHRLKGRTFNEISTQLNTTTNTCQGQYYNSIKYIKHHIEKNPNIKKEAFL